MALTVDEKKDIEDVRILIDDYRIAHEKFKTPGEQAQFLGPLISSMFDLKISDSKTWPFFTFFDKSIVYNVEALGYDSKEDFDSTASIADKATLEAMWK